LFCESFLVLMFSSLVREAIWVVLSILLVSSFTSQKNRFSH
jgi:hypothetical protein